MIHKQGDGIPLYEGDGIPLYGITPLIHNERSHTLGMFIK